MRVVLRALLGVGCSLFVGLGAEEARAANSLKVEGFDLLGRVGLGFSSAEPSDGRYLSADEKNSYILLGVKGGYTWPSGLRLGVDAQCGFNVLICATLTAGPSVGYDLVFSSFRFRGALDAGVWFAYGPAKPLAGLNADSKSKRESVAEVQAHHHTVRVDLSVPPGQPPNVDPVPERTEHLETFDVPRALGSGAARPHQLDEDETTKSEHGSPGTLARRDIPIIHVGQTR